PNFKNVRSLMNEAYNLGTEYVLVEINNESFQILPYRLEQALLNMDTYGLDEFWTVFHGEKVKDLDYDYKMELELRRINISPEQVLQREFLRENEIVDGWEYQYDRNGNVMKDSLGNDIKVDKVVKVRARVNEFEQYKESQMLANVNFHDLRSERLLKSFPIESQFVFSNIYSTFRGDERALNFEDRQLLRNRPVQFPTNEQMVLDTGEDLKQKMRQIIRNFNFN
ncbi:MAG: hypothetical protein R3213_07035, partial [Flavobacteriaceae bacterium]|nr:hypothetical protein [Flavobacteriaceae bacterium]